MRRLLKGVGQNCGYKKPEGIPLSYRARHAKKLCDWFVRNRKRFPDYQLRNVKFHFSIEKIDEKEPYAVLSVMELRPRDVAIGGDK